MRVVSKTILVKFLVPSYIMEWTIGLRSVKGAFEDLEVIFLSDLKDNSLSNLNTQRHMLSLIREGRSSVKEESDLLSLLVKACDDDVSVKLNDSDLMGTRFRILPSLPE